MGRLPTTPMPTRAMAVSGVEDYRKPEYQVRVSPAKARVLQGETMPVVIDARYFFGEPVANAKVKYRVYHSPHYWWDEAVAAMKARAWEPMLGMTMLAGLRCCSAVGTDGQARRQRQADHQRPHAVRCRSEAARLTRTTPLRPRSPIRPTARSPGAGRFLATRGSFRIHVEPVSYAVRIGDPRCFNVTAVDYDNKPVQTKVHLQLVHRKWSNGKTETTQGPATDVTTDASGQAQARSPVADAQAARRSMPPRLRRRTAIVYGLYLAVGDGRRRRQDWGGEFAHVQIIADKKSYAPGDTAHLSILSHVDNFHALVVATGYSVEFKKVISSDGKTLTFDLPITADAQPNLELSVAFICRRSDVPG